MYKVVLYIMEVKYMSTKIDTSNSALTSSFYLGKYYSPNREAKKSSSRIDIADNLLISYDTKALNKFIKDVRSLNFNAEQSNADTNLKNKVGAFVSIYNNFKSSTAKSTTNEVKYRAEKITKLTKSQSEALKDIGITVKSDSTLEIDEDKLKNAKIEDVKKLFSNSSDFMKQIKKSVSKVNMIL